MHRFAKTWCLSQQQAVVTEHLVRGESNQEIVDALHRKPKTIQTHATRTYQKTGVTNRAQLTALFWARPNGVKRSSIRVFPDRD